MDLNPAQREAVATLRGPLLVLAGAGTGKTRVVTHRIGRLIRHRTPPARILAVTFTNKAANEMQERVARLIGKRRKEKPEISTFHSLCVRILRRHIKRLGYPEAFAICDRGDQESLARAALREIRVPEATLRPGDLIYLIGGWKTAAVRPPEAAATAATDREHLAAAAYRRYQKALKAAGAVDFDDLLLCTEEIFRRFPDARRDEAGRFDQVLVDEYQDTNTSQYRIVQGLAEGHRNLCVVGDDDQSIYGWRGADLRHILRFKNDWPEAKVVRLETNYRSTREILAWANRLIAFNRERHPKRLRAVHRGEKPRILQLEDAETEARTVVEEIRSRTRTKRKKPRDFAVLFRTNEQARQFETEFRRADVPYVIVGASSFYDRKEVRDVLAYVKLVVNPRDEVSLLRVINTPPRGIGQTTVTRMLEQAVAAGRSVWDTISKSTPAGVTASAARGIEEFRTLVARYRKLAKRQSPAEVVAGLIRDVNYRDELTRLYPDVQQQEARWAAVEEVVNAAAGYSQKAKGPTLGGFLSELALNSGDDDRQKESQVEQNAVTLMTLHAAKGLEFPEVYLVGMEEGFLPHHRSIKSGDASVDEERRLGYVGVTRAQRRLTLTLSLARKKWGKSRPTIPSRFLYEITGQADNPNYAAALQGKAPKRLVPKPPPSTATPGGTASKQKAKSAERPPKKTRRRS